ncbi:Hypothetical protein GOX2194 [Gluconobacter oxydans 621H]|uniref:Uncharacterized protein n=1 Tax=Gluconobacter oxydans (strain 621H) TaxID=290633 RepID=Q5FNW6_GLUOX|nr:Hypothetical protein GOX2194 [Gluconobacter oxydans 621H]
MGDLDAAGQFCPPHGRALGELEGKVPHLLLAVSVRFPAGHQGTADFRVLAQKRLISRAFRDFSHESTHTFRSDADFIDLAHAPSPIMPMKSRSRALESAISCEAYSCFA